LTQPINNSTPHPVKQLRFLFGVSHAATATTATFFGDEKHRHQHQHHEQQEAAASVSVNVWTGDFVSDAAMEALLSLPLPGALALPQPPAPAALPQRISSVLTERERNQRLRAATVSTSIS
jgi:hypothetical protein